MENIQDILSMYIIILEYLRNEKRMVYFINKLLYYKIFFRLNNCHYQVYLQCLFGICGPLDYRKLIRTYLCIYYFNIEMLLILTSFYKSIEIITLYHIIVLYTQ